MGLNVEVLESLARSEKERWQRKVNQGVLKEDRVQQLMALGSMEAVDQFLYALKQEAEREELRQAESRKVQRKIAGIAAVPLRRGSR